VKKLFLLFFIVIFFLFSLSFVSANEKYYNFSGITDPTTTHNATFGADSDLPPDTLILDEETEFSEGSSNMGNSYTNVTLADDLNASYTPTLAREGSHKFEFVIDESVASITEINVTWRGIGIGTLPITSYGVNLYIWNNTVSVWDIISSHTNSINQDINSTFNTTNSNIADYLDGDNHLFLLAESTTAKSFNNIRTDYIEVLVNYNAASNPPVFSDPVLGPSPAYENDTLNCSTNSITDSEGDNAEVWFYFFNDTIEYTSVNYSGVPTGSSLSAVMIDQNPAKNEPWNCTVQVSDGTTYANNKTATLNISDAAPALNDTIPTTDSTVAESENQTFEINTTDIDDDLIYFTWYIDGVWNKSDSILNYSEFNFTSGYRDSGTYNISVNLSDSVNEVWWNWTLTITDNAYCQNLVCEGTESCGNCPEDCGGCSGSGSSSGGRTYFSENKKDKKEEKKEKEDEKVSPPSTPLEEVEERTREDVFFDEIGLDEQEKKLLGSVPGDIVFEDYKKENVDIETVLKPYELEISFYSDDFWFEEEKKEDKEEPEISFYTDDFRLEEEESKPVESGGGGSGGTDGITREVVEEPVLMKMNVYADKSAGEDFKAKPRLNFYFTETETMPFWCSDNKKNYDEKSVDCGGSCGDCGTIKEFCGNNVCSDNEKNYCIKDCKKRSINYYNILPVLLIFLFYMYFKSNEYERKHRHHGYMR